MGEYNLLEHRVETVPACEFHQCCKSHWLKPQLILTTVKHFADFSQNMQSLMSRRRCATIPSPSQSPGLCTFLVCLRSAGTFVDIRIQIADAALRMFSM